MRLAVYGDFALISGTMADVLRNAYWHGREILRSRIGYKIGYAVRFRVSPP